MVSVKNGKCNAKALGLCVETVFISFRHSLMVLWFKD